MCVRVMLKESLLYSNLSSVIMLQMKSLAWVCLSSSWTQAGEGGSGRCGRAAGVFTLTPAQKHSGLFRTDMKRCRKEQSPWLLLLPVESLTAQTGEIPSDASRTGRCSYWCAKGRPVAGSYGTCLLAKDLLPPF